MRVGAALSTLVILGVSGLAYLLVADVYDMYPQLAYRAIFSVLGVLIPLPLAFFFGLVTVRHTLSLHRLMASAARCMWGFFGLFLLTWLLEGLLIGEAPAPSCTCASALSSCRQRSRTSSRSAHAASLGHTHALTSQRLSLLELHDNLLRRVLRELPHGHPFCRPQAAGTTQHNPLATNGPKTQTPPGVTPI